MLVLGVGNPLRGDDGVGPEVASRVALLEIPGVDIATEADPLAILDHLGDPSAHEAVVVVDAMAPTGHPGRLLVHPVGEARLVGRDSPFGSHGLGVAHAVELARSLELLPPRLTLVGVEAECTRLGTGLSVPVVGRLEDAVRAVVEALIRPARPEDRSDRVPR